jgi:hypothetical protein
MWPPQDAIPANYSSNSLERTAIRPYKLEIPMSGSFIPGTSPTGTMDRRGLMEQSDDISLEALEGGLGRLLGVQWAASLPFAILNPKLVAMTTTRNSFG